jgi:hypothetical protein
MMSQKEDPCSGTTYQSKEPEMLKREIHLPEDVLPLICHFVGLVTFCLLHSFAERSVQRIRKHGTATAYTVLRYAGASINCAQFALDTYRDWFNKPKKRVFLISGAIRLNRPKVVR